MIHKLLEAMGSEACLPVELFDIVQRVLLRRSTDVKVTNLLIPFQIRPLKAYFGRHPTVFFRLFLEIYAH